MSNPDLQDVVPRTGSEERAYFLKRAEDHRRLADSSLEPGACSIHLRLRQLYLEQADLTPMVFQD